MVRTSLLSLAMVVLTWAVAHPAAPAAAEKTGFRVYSVSIRCQNRTFHGVYASSKEAFRVASELRGKSLGQQIEVSTGMEGKQVPVGRPALYEVYTRSCTRSDWERQARFVDAKQADEAVKAHKAKYTQVEIVHDFATKEVFQVYGVLCRGRMQLQGTYVTLREANAAAEELRTKKNFRCDVTTGTKGQEIHQKTPSQYQVYVQSCKGSWSLAATTKDIEEVRKVYEANKTNGPVEIVKQYTSK